jgi:type II secretory pathway component GspD/PulD (secretin)
MTARTWWTSLLAGCCILALHIDPAAAQAAPAKAKPSSMRTMTYPVADLVVPMPNDAKAKGKTKERELMTMIQNVIAPKSWRQAGGDGRIQYFPATMSLVVSANAEIHAELGAMIEALRRLQDTQVCLELRVVEMSPEMAEIWRRLSGMAGPQGEVKNTAMVSPEHLRSLLADAQECARTNVLCAPKVTTLSGQQAVIHTGSTYQFVSDFKTKRDGDETAVVPVRSSKELGLRAEFNSVVSPNRQEVRVKFRVDSSHLVETKLRSVPLKPAVDEAGKWDLKGTIESPVFASQVAEMEKAIPVGKTLMVSMGETKSRFREESRVPVLSELPQVGEWFRSSREGTRTQHVFLMVTPSVLVEEASAPEFQGAVPPVARP